MQARGKARAHRMRTTATRAKELCRGSRNLSPEYISQNALPLSARGGAEEWVQGLRKRSQVSGLEKDRSRTRESADEALAGRDHADQSGARGADVVPHVRREGDDVTVVHDEPLALFQFLAQDAAEAGDEHFPL